MPHTFDEAQLPQEIQIFTRDEIEKATDFFDHAPVRDGGEQCVNITLPFHILHLSHCRHYCTAGRLLGLGGFGAVYSGCIRLKRRPLLAASPNACAASHSGAETMGGAKPHDSGVTSISDMIEVPVAVKTLDQVSTHLFGHSSAQFSYDSLSMQDDGLGHAAGLSGEEQFEAEVRLPDSSHIIALLDICSTSNV